MVDEAGDGDEGLVAVLLEEQPLQHLCSLQPVRGQERRALGQVEHDRIGLGQLPEDERTVTRYFDTSAFTIPTNFTMGNASRAALRRDGIALVDISLVKEFRFSESKSLDFRIDMYNAFNHGIFDAANATLDSGAYGSVTTAADPRTMQLGVRFSF